MMPEPIVTRPPRLPSLLAAPFSLFPDALHSRLLVLALNSALQEPLRDGEPDFLTGRWLTVRVRDAGIRFDLSFDGDKLVAGDRDADSELSVEGSVYDFLLLVGRQVDPDTLVFQRRLVMQGDTELGLAVKNFLDGLDMESIALYRTLEPLLNRALPLYRRAFTR